MVEANNTGIKTPRAVLNLALAKKMTVAAEAKAKEIGVPMYISIVDASANLVSVNRMEDAILVSEEISINKAYTAAAIKLPTDVVATVAQPGTSLYGMPAADRRTPSRSNASSSVMSSLPDSMTDSLYTPGSVAEPAFSVKGRA